MKLTEFQRLKKFLMLAANNDSDAEAIRAFRRATEIIRAHGYTWEQVMDRRVTVLQEVEASEVELVAPVAREADELEQHHFDMAARGAQGSFADLISSIHEQWESGRALSPRQRQVIINAAERAAACHPGGRVR